MKEDIMASKMLPPRIPNNTSFCIKVNYILVRGSENSDSVLLQEYQFELKYD